MHAGVDHQPHCAQHFAALERLQPFDRIVIEAEFVAEALGIQTPALAEGSEPAVAHEFGQVLVLDREHRLEVMPRIAFVHVERDRGAQLAFGDIVAAEIEGARTRPVGLARHVAGGEAEFLAIGFVRLDPQLGLGLAQEHFVHQRIDLFGDFVPRGLEVGLAGVGGAAAATGFRLGGVDRGIDPRNLGQSGVVDLLRGQRQRRVVLDAVGVIGLAAGIAGCGDAGARLCQIFARQVIAQLLQRGHQRAGQHFAVLLRQPRALGFVDAVGEIGNRRPIGALLDRRAGLQVELFDHQFDRHARQRDALRRAGAEARDRLVDDFRHRAVAAEIVLVILHRIIGHQRAGRGKARVEDMQPAEMVDRQREHGGQHVGRGLRQRALLRVFEHVVGDAVGFPQRGAVDCRQFGQIGLRRGAVRGIAGGRIIAHPVGIGEIAAEEGGYRIAVEHGGFAAFEQRVQRGSGCRIACFGRGFLRQRGGCGKRGAGNGDRRCDARESGGHDVEFSPGIVRRR